jgi:hypothetical protein
MPGWLVREEVEYDTSTLDVIAHTGSRDVVAAHMVEGDVEPAHQHKDFWHVLGPGQLQPSLRETADEMKRRTRHRLKVPPGAKPS